MKKIYYLLTFALLLSSCDNTDIGPDEKIQGKWRDANTLYSFTDNDTYYIKYLRRGISIENDTVLPYDSIFGTYYIDRSKDHLTFELRGYINRFTGDTLVNNIDGTTWKYNVEGDTLRYESNTTLGTLFKTN